MEEKQEPEEASIKIKEEIKDEPVDPPDFVIASLVKQEVDETATDPAIKTEPASQIKEEESNSDSGFCCLFSIGVTAQK